MPSFLTNADETGQSVPSFVRPQSMGVETDRSKATLFSGIADLGKMAVDTIDQTFKNVINDTATAEVDAARSALTNDRKAIADVNQQRPAGLEEGLKRLARAKEASAAGVLNDSYRDIMYDSISRDLRYKYAGYREYIDDRIHKLTGIQPANALVNDLKAEAIKNMGSEDKYYQNTRMKLIEQGVDVTAQEKANGGRSLPIDNIEEQLARAYKVKADTSALGLISKQMEVNKTSDEEVARQGTHLLSEKLTQNLQFGLNNINRALGANESSVQEMALRFQADPESFTPVMQEKLKLEVGKITQQTALEARNYLTQSQGGQKSLQAQFRLSNEQVETMVQQQVGKATAVYQPLFNKEFGAFASNVRALEATKTSDDARFLANDVTAGHATIRRNMGDLVANSVATQSGGLTTLLSNIDKLAVQRGKQSVLNGEVRSLAQMDAEMRKVEHIKRLNVNQAAVTEAASADLVNIITDKNSGPTESLKAIKAVFHKDNQALLANMVVKKGDVVDPVATKELQINTYQKLTTKAVQDGVKKWGEVDPRVIENYSNFTVNTGLTLNKQTLDNVKQDIINNQDSFAKINFNPETATFSAAERNLDPKRLRQLELGSPGFVSAAKETELRRAQLYADQLNAVTRQIKPALEMTGAKDIGNALAVRFNSMGININALSPSNLTDKFQGRMNMGVGDVADLQDQLPATPTTAEFDNGGVGRFADGKLMSGTDKQPTTGLEGLLSQLKETLELPQNEDTKREIEAMYAQIGRQVANR